MRMWEDRIGRPSTFLSYAPTFSGNCLQYITNEKKKKKKTLVVPKEQETKFEYKYI